MPSLDVIIAKIVQSAGGTVYGRLKIQKIMYLLDQKGLESGAKYFYHHYGPYSEDVSNGIMDAKFFGLLDETVGHRQSDGAPYSYFEVSPDIDIEDDLEIGRDEFSSLVRRLQNENSTVLEIASTIHWLSQVERVPNWRDELLKRKSSKASPERVDAALRLLREIQLAV